MKVLLLYIALVVVAAGIQLVFGQVGSKARRGDYEEVGSVVGFFDKKERHLCSGTLVRGKTVLTSATCVSEHTPIEVQFEKVTRTVVDVRFHPEFRSGRDGFDLALILLDSKVLGVTPATWDADSGGEGKGKRADLAGWNPDSPFPETRDLPDLFDLEVEIVEGRDCEREFSFVDENDYLCATERRSVDPFDPSLLECNWDLGAPLIINSGIVSGMRYFPSSCVIGGLVAYTRISTFAAWIEETVNLLDPTPEPTVNPTLNPTKAPTRKPTLKPTFSPTKKPTNKPTTATPTKQPTTRSPTKQPTTGNPTKQPTTGNPTKQPTTGSPTLPQPTPSPVIGSGQNDNDGDLENSNGTAMILGIAGSTVVVIGMFAALYVKKKGRRNGGGGGNNGLDRWSNSSKVHIGKLTNFHKVDGYNAGAVLPMYQQNLGPVEPDNLSGGPFATAASMKKGAADNNTMNRTSTGPQPKYKVNKNPRNLDQALGPINPGAPTPPVPPRPDAAPSRFSRFLQNFNVKRLSAII